MNALCNSRTVSGRRSACARASLTTMRYISEVERECADVRRNLALRVREQSAETMLDNLRYAETKNPFNRAKEVCTQTRRKKKNRSECRKRASQIQAASMAPYMPEVDAETTLGQANAAIFTRSSAPAVEPSSQSFTSAKDKSGLSFKTLFRRYSGRPQCAPSYEEMLPSTMGVRSARSFIGEQYRSVGAF